MDYGGATRRRWRIGIEAMFLIEPDQITSTLTYDACIGVMREAMARLSSGDTNQILRQILPLDAGRMFGVMAGTMGPGAAFGSKLVCVTPERGAQPVPSHQGVVVVFDAETGAPACVAEAGAITAIRTASTSAMATDVLARADSRILAVLGTGEQALHHALAIPHVRQIDEIRIWGRSLEKAQCLAAEVAQKTGISTQADAKVADAVSQADIICTVTAAAAPILFASDVSKGTHINVVGSSFDGPREIDDTVVAISRFYADSTPSVRAQGAEFRHALNSGAVAESHLIGEIGEVLVGKVSGRQSDIDITLFKSLGHIIQDVASAEYIYGRLKAQDS